MNEGLSKEWFWEDNFYYSKKQGKNNTYIVELFVCISNNELYLNGTVNAGFQASCLFIPFIFKHSVSKKLCEITLNKNYI